ncbi:MAG: HAMP domain-containing histidine kinase, partial [Polyangiaceae bacterium]|nr:HAMP domain-containing histidine kinase [Polyangiaceae bacterium]
ARDRPAERSLVSPRDIVKGALDLLPNLGLPVEVVAPDDLPEVSVDPGQIRQLVTNLVSNAAEATRGHGSKVVIELGSTEEGFRFRVDDEGPGFSDEVREHLFEPLFTTRAKGIGLGLALCKRIVERHGGSICAENRPSGGARFEVLLPQQRRADT